MGDFLPPRRGNTPRESFERTAQPLKNKKFEILTIAEDCVDRGVEVEFAVHELGKQISESATYKTGVN